MTPNHTHCRICRTKLPEPFLDLGSMPLANSFLRSTEEFRREASYPLAVALCPNCGLVQLNCVVPAEQLYRQYLYVSSTSDAVRHYAGDLAKRVVSLLKLGPKDRVVELGSNDGLVLKAFQQQGVQVTGVEPARNLAAVARENGVPTVAEFFGEESAARVAKEYGPASMILGRHVFAHIDDLHGFFRGVEKLLAPDGALLIEVPYLGTLLSQMEFDTIYHEHLSYLAIRPVQSLCEQHGFLVADIEKVPLHGGSVMFWIRRAGKGHSASARLQAMVREEQASKLTEPETWARFAEQLETWKQSFEESVEALSKEGARWIGYGAAAKANTLLNYCPSVAKHLAGVLDRNPLKQGSFTPGTHLPVLPPDAWEEGTADHMLILAWNFKEEILAQMEPFAKKGGRFLVPIPRPELV